MEKTRKKNMVMTNEDIVRSYKEAKDRRAQIKVLAELNVCPQELIIEILKEGGVDWRELPRQRKKADVAASSSEACETASSASADGSSKALEKAAASSSEPCGTVSSASAGGSSKGLEKAEAADKVESMKLGTPPTGIVEEALQLLRRELVRTVKELREEYEAIMAQYSEKIGEIDLILCGQK